MFILRDRTLSMYEEGPEGFYGVMKHFRHVLMGHEIFAKNFDGLQNIFLCSIFLCSKGVGSQNIPTSHEGDLRKAKHVK